VKGMGSVERVLVLGIVVVIVAILGIAVWGASDDDANGLEPTATDGGAVVQAPFAQPDGMPANITPPEAAPPAEPMSEIDRLKARRRQRSSRWPHGRAARPAIYHGTWFIRLGD